ncbi:MAG: hypothetical protein IKO00_13280 [Oscillospiraceae bacterium]|nr:hypothetical protein [Oscillospiraceae bacterium]
MWKLIKVLVLTVAVSFYLFPFSFPFLPYAINSKILIAVFGIASYIYDSIRKQGMYLSEPTLFSGLLAAIFSVWCLFCITIANTFTTVYADYLVSFLTWMFGAYGVFSILRLAYEEVDLEILVRYLALVGVFQCVAAVMIDNISFVQNLVDHIHADAPYYREHDRMYGLGVALDPAGVRFSVILVMIAHQFSTCPNVRNSSLYQATDLVAFAIITIIGAVISRTTVVGAGLGMFYIIITLIRMRKGGFITTRMVQAFFWFFIVMAGIIGAAVYFYQHSVTFQGYLRFGFEAFFNWVETGEFSTHSTDILETMWVWPTDTRTWIIGRGVFGVFETNSDIGYCNFISLCGLIGMVIFSIFFLYCHIVQNRKFRMFGLASILLSALTFIIWMKVATDIFFIDALLFCIVGDYDMETEEADAAPILPSDIGLPKM